MPRPKLKATSKPKPLTKEEKDLVKAKKQQRSARVRLNIAQRKLAKIARSTEDNDIAEKATESLPEAYPVQEESTQEVLFQPNPGPQTNFLAAPEREVLYGGAAGGGKTYSLIVDPLRYCNNSNMNALILRRTNDELREIIHKSQEMYPQAFPGAKWMEKKSQWTFPSGARIWMTYLEQEKDVLRYQGQAFTYIGFDEITSSVVLNKSAIVNKKFYLKASSIQLNTVQLSAERQDAKTSVNTSVVKLTPKTLKKLPSIGGEADIAQYLQVLPGVVFTGDQGGQLYIRGGAPIHNVVLLDGMILYNAFHSIGLFSVFDTV